jgi:putative FmdB family regulatory protein
MPTYEYRCQACGEHLEVVQSFADEPLTTCGKCGGTLRKVFSPVGVVFKGSGFYKTDNRSSRSSRSDAKPEAKPEPKPEAAKESSSSTVTEAKSA